jgi:hypothetical protein
MRRDIALSFIVLEKRNSRLRFVFLSSSLQHPACFSLTSTGLHSFGKQNRHHGASVSERDRVAVEKSRYRSLSNANGVASDREFVCEGKLPNAGSSAEPYESGPRSVADFTGISP